MPILAGISIYPIKSLDPHFSTEIRIGAGGQLEHDREFALFDAGGKCVRAKRHAKFHLLRAKYDLRAMRVSLCEEGKQDAQTFHLLKERAKLEDYFTRFFGLKVTLERNEKNGFPDDSSEWGPTLISTGTLKEVAAWFPGLKADDVWKRFRPNLVIGGTEAFWEDRLYGKQGEGVAFRIGDVQFRGTNPCVRCVVPTRDPSHAEPIPEFAKIFMERRKASLPAWAEGSRFADTFYRLAVNTRVEAKEACKELMIGDNVEVEA